MWRACRQAMPGLTPIGRFGIELVGAGAHPVGAGPFPGGERVVAMVVGDGELVRAALAGDASCLGLVLERHRAEMRAVAIGVLGYGPAAEDAVQEAMVTALRSLGSLRDPDAVGGWLRAITRNACRMQVRATRPALPLDGVADEMVAGGETVEEVLDRHALRDWIWHAIGQLSEPLQLVVLLRHFGPMHSYAQIADICEVPVGTVRSRLNQVRRQLAGLLLKRGRYRTRGRRRACPASR